VDNLGPDFRDRVFLRVFGAETVTRNGGWEVNDWRASQWFRGEDFPISHGIGLEKARGSGLRAIHHLGNPETFAEGFASDPGEDLK